MRNRQHEGCPEKNAAAAALANLSEAWGEAVACLSDLSPEDAKAVLGESGWAEDVCQALEHDADEARTDEEEEK